MNKAELINEIAARSSDHYSAGAEIEIPAKNVPHFSASAALKDAVA